VLLNCNFFPFLQVTITACSDVYKTRLILSTTTLLHGSVNAQIYCLTDGSERAKDHRLPTDSLATCFATQPGIQAKRKQCWYVSCRQEQRDEKVAENLAFLHPIKSQ
jgi:hypothetical protein